MDNFSLPHHHEDFYDLDEINGILGKNDDFQITADLFRNLGDPTRLRLFWLLCHHEECVVNIAALMNMSSPAVSHHLKILKDSGLITFRRDGQEVHYRAADSARSDILHKVIEQVMEIACPDQKDSNDHESNSPVTDDNYDQDCFKQRHCLNETGLYHEQHDPACCRHHSPEIPAQEQDRHLTKYREEQLIIIRKIHEELAENLDKRISLEDLSRKYLMNTTTIKVLFKELYGTSIAAHIRDHRMETAALLLRNTSDNISQVAAKVGYSSQSKFTAAFREYYGVLPKDYRKQ